MLINKLINKNQEISNKYLNKIIWGYIDIYTGKIIIYSPQLCTKIESYYQTNKKFIYIDMLNTIIYFTNSLKQITNNKKHSVFRIIGLQNKINNKIIINKKVIKNNNKYYLYKKHHHIGLLIDFKLINTEYKNNIYNILLHHHSIIGINKLYIPEQQINFKKINNYDDVFINNNKSIIHNFINILLHISKNYYNQEDVNIYILTTHEDYNLLLDIYTELQKKTLLHTNYNIIQLNKNCDIYMYLT